VVVAGPPGVGKTRLVDDVIGALSSDDWHVERVVGTPAISKLPLAAFAFIEEPISMDLDRFPMAFGSAHRSLVERASGRRLLLVIDDAHCLDDVSAALAYQLVAAGEAVVAATARTSAHAPEAIVALWKNEHCERMELQPLARSELDELVDAVLGGPVDVEALRLLWDASQGNLLYLRELIHDGLRTGSLFRDDVWRWRRPVRPPVGVRDLIGSQIDALSTEGRCALELVAHAEPLEWTLLASLAEEEVLEELVRDGHLNAGSDGRRLTAHLSHPLVAEVLRANVSEIRRRRIYGQLVDALNAFDQRRTDTLRRVTWTVDAGREVGPDELLEAARRVMLLDATRAESLAERASEAGAGLQADVVRAQVLMFANRAAAAEGLLSSIRTPLIGDDIEVTVMRAHNLTFGLYEPERAASLLDDLILRADAARSRYVRAQQLSMLLFAGQVAEVIDRARVLLDDEASAPSDRLRTMLTLIPAVAANGRPIEALRIADAANALAGVAERELPYARGQLAAGAILAMQWAGRLEDAEKLASIGYDYGVRQDATLLRGVSAYQLGLSAYWSGHMHTAQARFAEAVSALRLADVGFLPSACDHLVAAQALLGIRSSSDAVVAEGARFPLYATERARLEGVAAVGRGDLVQARELARRAADVAADNGLTMLEALALWDGARWGDVNAVRERLSEVACQCEGALAPAITAAIAAWSSSDGAALQSSARDLEQLGFVLWAAEMHRVAARIHAKAGLTARALQAHALADRLLAQCEGTSTPLAGRSPKDHAPDLTRREREVVELAARDFTNAEIAERLSISVRTVETHLQHVYDKLGLRSRRDLALTLHD
jgi:DNA-binding NarL/FixJ family response regulator